MSDPSQLNPTGRFSGLAEIYARCRPSYPAEALEYLAGQCGLDKGSVLVDVGCGTGISSRLFAAMGVRVIGIEPNDEMRASADAAASESSAQRVAYRNGRAEATGLPDACADAVLAAQAFHWFDIEPALQEFRRILKPDGWAILMWNERDDQDEFNEAYGRLIRRARDALTGGVPWSEQTGDLFLSSPQFHEGRCVTFRNQQTLDEEGLVGRAFSVSYAPKEPSDKAAWDRSLRALFQQYQRAGVVILSYRTSVYLARRS